MQKFYRSGAAWQQEVRKIWRKNEAFIWFGMGNFMSKAVFTDVWDIPMYR